MLKPLLVGSLGWPELLLIALVILIFFGAKRIPELMKSLGKGVKSFKQGMSEVEKDVKEIKSELESDTDEKKTVNKEE